MIYITTFDEGDRIRASESLSEAMDTVIIRGRSGAWILDEDWSSNVFKVDDDMSIESIDIMSRVENEIYHKNKEDERDD